MARTQLGYKKVTSIFEKMCKFYSSFKNDLKMGRKPTIVTTNLSFDRWSEIFGDPVLTAAMVDRLTHKAYLINMNGSSYRVKETKKWINN